MLSENREGVTPAWRDKVRLRVVLLGGQGIASDQSEIGTPATYFGSIHMIDRGDTESCFKVPTCISLRTRYYRRRMVLGNRKGGTKRLMGPMVFYGSLQASSGHLLSGEQATPGRHGPARNNKALQQCSGHSCKK